MTDEQYEAIQNKLRVIQDRQREMLAKLERIEASLALLARVEVYVPPLQDEQACQRIHWTIPLATDPQTPHRDSTDCGDT